MEQKEVEKTLTTTLELCERAAKIIEFADKTPEQKGATSIVTKADKEANDFLVNSIREIYPKHNIISEESPPIDNEATEQETWIIDPIDATRELVKSEGKGKYCIQVALVKQNRYLQSQMEPVIGVVHFPATNTVYFAAPAISRNLKKIAKGRTHTIEMPREVDKLEDSVLILSERKFTLNEAIEIKTELGMREVIQASSNGYKMMAIAEGKAHIYVSTRGWVWDVCAPEICLSQAGGRCSDYKGNKIPYGLGKPLRLERGIVASNGLIHEQAIAKIPKAIPLKTNNNL